MANNELFVDNILFHETILQNLTFEAILYHPIFKTVLVFWSLETATGLSGLPSGQPK